MTKKEKQEILYLIAENSEIISERNPKNPSFNKFYYKIRESALRLKVLKI